MLLQGKCVLDNIEGRQEVEEVPLMVIEFGCFDFRAYDRAALKFRGVEADINFNLSDYDEDMKQVV